MNRYLLNPYYLGDSVMLEPIAQLTNRTIICKTPELFDNHPKVKAQKDIPVGGDILDMGDVLGGYDLGVLYDYAGLNCQPQQPSLYLTKEEHSWVSSIKKTFNKRVGVVLSSRHLSKYYPYMQLLVYILSRRGYTVFCFDKTQQIHGVINITNSPIRNLMTWIAAMDLMIGPDTGLIHIAGALGVPIKVLGRMRCAGLFNIYSESETIYCLSGIKSLGVRKIIKTLSPIKRKHKHFSDFRVVFLSSWKVACGVAEYTKTLTECLPCDLEVVTDPLKVPDASLLHIQYEPGIFPITAHLDALLDEWQNPVLITAHYYDDWLKKNHSRFAKIIVHDKQYEKLPNHEYLIQGCPVFPEKDRDKLRLELGISADKKILASFGFYMPWKKLDVVFETLSAYISLDRSFHLLWLHSIHPRAKLYGADVAGHVRKLIALHRIEDNVTVAIDYMPKFYINCHLQAADLGFLWSPIEVKSGSSAVSKEFVAARCPLVVSNISHYGDLSQGVIRVDAHRDIQSFFYTVMSTGDNAPLLVDLREQQRKNYKELNYENIAKIHYKWYKELV